MQVQIVTYNLNGISEGDYLDVANQLAARFSALPGLQAKVWLEDPESNTYGGLYLWDDEESMERFLRSDLFEGTNPEFSNVTTMDFNVFENLTKLTQPVLAVLEEEGPPLYTPPPLPPTPGEEAAAASAPVVPLMGEEPRKARAKKATAKKAKKVSAKKVAAKKVGAKKVAAKKLVAKKLAAKKLAAKKLAAKKVGAKKVGAKKASAKRGGRAR